MFGRRRRVETEILELVRRELETVRVEVQTALAETAAVLSTRVRLARNLAGYFVGDGAFAF